MCNFLEDVIAMAKAITECPLVTMSGDYVTYVFCEYCGIELHGYQYRYSDFKHDPDCPVLKAQAILESIHI